ncbi:MAG: hypothetical protein WB493_15795 [Anaeromyxobacteraceae bacterium]
MFLGHLGLAFAAKRLTPRTGLGALGAASQWVDLVWPVLLLLGVERVRIAPGITAWTPLDFIHYPWTHSLLLSAGWGVALGLAWLAATRDRRGALVVGALVASHWFLDFLTHRPDLPLSPWGGAKVGLGLWNHPVATVAVEGAIFAAGVLLYATGTRPTRRSGSIGLWALLAFLVTMAGANQLSVPPGEEAVAWGTFSMWLLVAWMAWVDRRRQPAGSSSGAGAPGSGPP